MSCCSSRDTLLALVGLSWLCVSRLCPRRGHRCGCRNASGCTYVCGRTYVVAYVGVYAVSVAYVSNVFGVLSLLFLSFDGVFIMRYRLYSFFRSLSTPNPNPNLHLNPNRNLNPNPNLSLPILVLCNMLSIHHDLSALLRSSLE